MLYTVPLFAHSYLRWVVLALALIVLVRSFAGFLQGREWTKPDERLHGAFVGVVDLQFTLGLWLYLVSSPLSHAFFADVGGGMKQTLLRFFGLEHPVGMLLAVALVHVGRTRSKRAKTARLRHRTVWAFTLAAVLAMCASIPWPFMPAARPLLRSAAYEQNQGLDSSRRIAAAGVQAGGCTQLQPGGCR